MQRLSLILFILCLSFFVKAQKNNAAKVASDTSIIVDPIEPIPHFPGGQKAWNNFLKRHLRWPDKSGTIDVQGKVIVSFMVEKDGKLTNIKILRSLESLFDKEALRVVKISPNWIPAKQNGKTIRCSYYIPISFNIVNN